jgi:outer membrane protein assembly factor BamA
LLFAAAGTLGPRPLAAQRFWKNTLYPYAYYSTVDGFWGAAHFSEYSPIGYVERPEASLASIALDASASTQGSYLLMADAEAPAWWEGWRVALTLSAARANRLGYYGVGNETRYAADSVTAARPYFYQVSRTTQTARATLQRRVVGPLRILAGVTLQHTDFRELPGESVFARDLASGAVDSGQVPFSDRVVRAGVVIDFRDNELDPHRGVFAEALLARGTGYRRTTVAARAYVHPLERLILGARLAGERMTGTPPAAAQMVMESSEQPYIAVGGYRSLRGYTDDRFTGPGKLLGGVEARYALIWAPSLLELKLVAFYDAGRVFDAGDPVKVTSRGLHKAGGVELAARILRNSLLVAGWGRGSEGSQLFFGTTWSY